MLEPGGTNTEPVWTTVDGTQTACGTCHGLPPDGIHPPASFPADCTTCHGNIDATGTFIDPASHIDGVVDGL
jgi:hypothetical protein